MQQIVRITRLSKTLDTFENAVERILHSRVTLGTKEEVEAYKEGFKTALNLLRKEYGIDVK